VACNIDDGRRPKKLDTRQLDYTVDDIRQRRNFARIWVQ
jgi:hypothetical protein